MPMRYRDQTNWALPKPSRQSVHNLITPSDEVAKRQAGLFGLSDHLKRLSAYGDSLEELGRIIDLKAFRHTLRAALAYEVEQREAVSPMIRWRGARSTEDHSERKACVRKGSCVWSP